MLLAAERLRSQTSYAQDEAEADLLTFDLRVLLGPDAATHLPVGHYWNAPPHEELFATAIVTEIIEPGQIVVSDATPFPAAGYLFWQIDEEIGCLRYASHDAENFYDITTVRSARLPLGTQVTAYLEITDKLAQPVSMQGDFSQRIFSWTAEIEVEALPFLEDAAFSLVVLRRKVLGNQSGIFNRPWHLWFYGWVLEVSFEETWQGKRSRIQAGGFLELLRRQELPPLFSGSLALAAESNATASSTLSNLSAESGSDDFIRGTPVDVQPARVLDEDPNTLWISQNEPSFLSYLEPGPDAPSVIDEVYAWPTLEQTEDAQWFRIWLGYSTRLQGVRIVNQQTVWARQDSEEYGWTPGEPFINCDEWEGKNTTYARKPVIFCKNRTVFERFWDPGEAVVIEWSRLRSSRNFRLDPVQGFLHAKTGGPGWTTCCAWGTGSGKPPNDHWPGWVGPWVAPPSQLGWSLRTQPPHRNRMIAEDWVVEAYPNPEGLLGRQASDWQNEEWLQVILPTLDLTLGQALTAQADDPVSDEIPIKRAGEYDTSLLDNSGVLLIDGELISYTGRTARSVTGITRGVMGTTITAHLADAHVYPFENGRPSNAPKVSRISFLRPEELNPRIMIAKMHLTEIASPRNYGSDGWGVDWGYQPVKEWNMIGPMEFTSPGRRVQGIFLKIQQMAGLIGELAEATTGRTSYCRIVPTPYFSKIEPAAGYIYLGGYRYFYSSISGDQINTTSNVRSHPQGTLVYHLGGRARVNEVEIFPATQTVEGEVEPPSSNDVIDLIIWILTTKFGYSSDRIIRPSIAVIGPASVYFTRGNALEILTEICEDYALRIVERPDGVIEIFSESELGTRNVALYWSENLITELRSSGTAVTPVSQVILRLRDPVSGEIRTFRFPADPNASGNPVEVERSAPPEYGSLLAQLAYYDEVGRKSYEFACKGGLDYAWGGQIHKLPDDSLAMVASLTLREGSEREARLSLEVI